MKQCYFVAVLYLALILNSCCVSGLTNQQDVNVLKSLKKAWSSTLPWKLETDPCETEWLGVFCDSSNTVVTKLILPAQGISGNLPMDIGSFVNLQVLDLSYNRGLTGLLPLQLFRLINLTQLYVQNCHFYGVLPQDLGNLVKLKSLSLNHNFFSGSIPHTIGQLSELVWLDLSSNQLSGSLPSSMSMLEKANHFHLQSNHFSGFIPTGLFNSRMSLIHLLLHNNSFEGPIPLEIGNLTQLDILRLDHNSFTSIPQSLLNLVTMTTLHLNQNNLTGPLPDLKNLVNLQILNMGHNQFLSSSIPSWFSSFPNLSTIAVEAANLQGSVPSEIFSPRNLASVRIGFNELNGTLDLSKAGPNLIEVEIQQNSLSGFLGTFSGTLNLQGNPICQLNSNQLESACNPTSDSSLSTPSSACNCHVGYVSNPSAKPGTCVCAYPLMGALIFTALKVKLDSKLIPALKASFPESIPLITSEDQISISIISDVVANISIFPNNSEAWTASDANTITSFLSSSAILLPTVGPYEYLPFGQYSPQGSSVESRLSAAIQVALGTGGAAFTAALLIICVYALVQKKRAEKAEEISKPFVSWVSTRVDKSDAPKLKGARLFTLSELKRATHSFHKSREIGVGGYGKVYKGVLSSGEEVAIKKAQGRSYQGAAEFKNEIELLSRVHHRNLVCLMGFCFEEQMLVYEYVPNGTLQDSLLGHSNVQLDWQRRIAIALGSAKGLAYLHNEANPSVIHRDVKSSNILLDSNLDAKVADFGLSKLAPDVCSIGNGHVSTQVKGTLGYLDPEYCTTQRLSDKSDVYSFGVVLLELITSRQPIEQGKHIVREVRTTWLKGGLQAVMAMVDPLIKDCPQSELQVILDIALRCVEEEGTFRPTMKQIAKEIEAIVMEQNCIPPISSYSCRRDPAFQYSGDGVTVTVEPK